MAKLRLKRGTTRAIRWLRRRHGHGVHSPFAFRLITRVIEEPYPYYCYKEIEQLRRSKLKGVLTKKDLQTRRAMSRKRASLLFRLVNHFKPTTILEIGSSWGISTLYMQQGNPQATYYCIEPQEQVRTVAKEVVACMTDSVQFLPSPVAEALPPLLDQLNELGFLFVHNMASAHQYQSYMPVILPHIHHQTVVVVEDIHKDKATTKVWRQLIASSQVRVSMDLYDIGIAVCSPKYNKQDYVVAF